MSADHDNRWPAIARSTHLSYRSYLSYLPDSLLHSHDVVGLLKPSSELVVEVIDGSDRYEVKTPSRAVIFRSSDPRALQPPVKRESGHEVILARRESGKSDARDTDEAGLLRKDLDIAKRPENVDVSPGESER